MAHYSETVYSETGTNLSLTLPDDYSAYKGLSVEIVFWSDVSPEYWSASRGYNYRLIYNGNVIDSVRLNSSVINGVDDHICSYYTTDDDNQTVYAGDTFTIEIDVGDDIYSFYMVHALFFFAEAGDFKNYLYVYPFVQVAVLPSSVGTYYVTSEQYAEYFNPWGPPNGFVPVVLNGTGENYYPEVTYYQNSESKVYLTLNGSKLYVEG